jgi:hypothetical protein
LFQIKAITLGREFLFMDQTKPTRTFFNIVTQEEITREMNDDEYAQYLIDQENFKNSENAVKETNN